MNRVISSAVALGFIVHVNPTMAVQELERVTITGKSLPTSNNALSGRIGTRGTNWGAGGSLAADPVETAGKNSPTQDIRCWDSNQGVTSQDDGDVRFGLATQLYRAHVGAGLAQKVGSWFTVTWADGGTTSYQVASNGAVAQLSVGVERNSPGDGVAKAGPVCGKG